MDADDKQKHGALRKAGRVALRLLTPIPAMRRSATLAKKEFGRTRDNLVLLKDLGGDARKAVVHGIKGEESKRNDSFEMVMRNASQEGVTQTDLYRIFLRKKRIALGTAAFFLLLGVYGMVGGMFYGNPRGVVLGLISLVSSQPVFFMLALGAQLRLWQLRTHRLSREERGGLKDFMREARGWWWMTLDPEFGRGRKQP